MDLDGQDRVSYCRVDMGAFEVADAPTGAPAGVVNSGSNWYCTIQEALDDAADGTTITVYEGRYLENVKIPNKGISIGFLSLARLIASGGGLFPRAWTGK